MAEFGRGAKAGVIAGIIYGIIAAILSLIIIVVMWETILDVASKASGVTISAVDMGGLIGFMAPFIFIGAIIGGIIFGLIFGLIYAAIYRSLPGSTSIMKAIVLSFIAWLIFSLGLGYSSIATYGTSYYIASNVVVGLVSWIIWGALMGIMWDRFGGSPRPMQPPVQ